MEFKGSDAIINTILYLYITIIFQSILHVLSDLVLKITNPSEVDKHIIFIL